MTCIIQSDKMPACFGVKLFPLPDTDATKNSLLLVYETVVTLKQLLQHFTLRRKTHFLVHRKHCCNKFILLPTSGELVLV